MKYVFHFHFLSTSWNCHPPPPHKRVVVPVCAEGLALNHYSRFTTGLYIQLLVSRKLFSNKSSYNALQAARVADVFEFQTTR